MVNELNELDESSELRIAIGLLWAYSIFLTLVWLL